MTRFFSFMRRALAAGFFALRPNLLILLMGAALVTGVSAFGLKMRGEAILLIEMKNLWILQVAILVNFWALIFYGAFASLLDEAAPRGLGFAHLRGVKGGFGGFLWRCFLLVSMSILIWLLIAFLVGAGITVITFVMSEYDGHKVGRLIGIVATICLLPLCCLAVARYGLSLPAFVAGDADCGFKTARQRVKPCFWRLSVALFCIPVLWAAAVFLTSALIGLTVRQTYPQGVLLTLLFWMGEASLPLLSLATAPFYAGALAAAWREKKEEARAEIFA